MRKAAFWLVVMCVVAVGGAKGYLWYDVKQTTDRFVRQVAPLVEVRYGGIHTSLTGSAGLDDITLRAAMTGDEFHIRALRVEAPNLLFFLAGSRQLDAGRIPRTLGLELQGVEIDLESEIFRLLAQMQQQTQQGRGAGLSLEHLDALGCGELGSWGPNDYLRAGLTRMSIDLSMRMNYEKSERRIVVSLTMSDPELYRLDSALYFNAPSDRLQDVRLDEFPQGHLNYSDHGWHQLRNPYCARLNGDTEEAYVQRHLDLLRTRHGIVLPPETAEAYRDLMLNGGSVSVSLEPFPGTPLTGLEHYAPADVMDLLGMRIAINGVTLEREQIDWQRTRRAQVAAPHNAPPRSSAASPPERAPAAGTPRYRVVAVQQLPGHLRHPIRVTTRDGRVREGVLTAVEGGRIRVALQRSAGGLTFWVNNSDLKQVEVRY